MWRWRRVISVFAIIIVILTSGVVALVSWAWIPGFTLALGFLLGGIVSPPDAISATSVMRLVRVPRRLTYILEGESLLNDASSLIIYKFALAAVDTGRFVFQDAIGSFFLVIIMGVATGVVIGLVYYAIYHWLPTNPDIDIVLTLTAPYVMYLTAESMHFSTSPEEQDQKIRKELTEFGLAFLNDNYADKMSGNKTPDRYLFPNTASIIPAKCNGPAAFAEIPKSAATPSPE
jgi:NhaP-type Na+/H+ or K+/H+ antiporter